MKYWPEFFNSISDKDYCKSLKSFLDEEYKRYTIYPTRENMFNAFRYTPAENVKVVIIGQDPYHEPNQAMGLAFSVPEGEKLPPSLVNIYKELDNDLGLKMKNSGDLRYLSAQGVLLLNAYLTVRAHQPLSHKIKEYDCFLEDTLKYIDSLNQPIVFMLWGGFAKKYEKYVHNPKHIVLKCNHPSPLSANRGGWFNEHQFSKCNKFLKENGVEPIDWQN